MSRIRSIVSRGSGDVLRGRDRRRQKAEAGTVPAENGLRLDDGDRATPRRQQARADEQLQPVHEVELRALAAASKNVDLVAEDGVLDDQLPVDRTASTATPAISLTDLRGARCDHSRSMRARNHVRIRETLGKHIRRLEHKRGSRSRRGASTPAMFPPGCVW
jgi:hypothetical protein